MSFTRVAAKPGFLASCSQCFGTGVIHVLAPHEEQAGVPVYVATDYTCEVCPRVQSSRAHRWLREATDRSMHTDGARRRGER